MNSIVEDDGEDFDVPDLPPLRTSDVRLSGVRTSLEGMLRDRPQGARGRTLIRFEYGLRPFFCCRCHELGCHFVWHRCRNSICSFNTRQE
jgi:hypothetical protein